MTAGMNIRPFEPNRDFWDGRRVAVTGATGFVGTHLTSALAALGARVVALLNSPKERRPSDGPPLGAGQLNRLDIGGKGN